MLSCAEFLTEFGDYLDRVATPNLRVRLEEHLRECKTCRVIVDSTNKTIQFVTDYDTFTLPPDKVEPIVSEVMAKVRSKAVPGS